MVAAVTGVQNPNGFIILATIPFNILKIGLNSVVAHLLCRSLLLKGENCSEGGVGDDTQLQGSDKMEMEQIDKEETMVDPDSAGRAGAARQPGPADGRYYAEAMTKEIQKALEEEGR